VHVSETTPTPPLFPLFLRLAGRRVVLVGGGVVAAGKLAGLLEAGAHVDVIAPEVHPDIEAAGERSAEALARRPEALPIGRVRIVRRPFEPADLDGAWFVVAAAPRGVNRLVADAATARGIFVNAVDDVEHASAYAGAIERRAGVTIAIGTDGRAPALAGLLREAIGALLPQDLDRWMSCAAAERGRWIATKVPMERRRPQLLRALVGLYSHEQ
jgi:siroheme synthase-like protein